jgi:hypothetical protein
MEQKFTLYKTEVTVIFVLRMSTECVGVIAIHSHEQHCQYQGICEASLPYDRSAAPSEASSPQTAI